MQFERSDKITPAAGVDHGHFIAVEAISAHGTQATNTNILDMLRLAPGGNRSRLRMHKQRPALIFGKARAKAACHNRTQYTQNGLRSTPDSRRCFAAARK